MQSFLDLAGLSPHCTPEYIKALAIDAVPIAPEHRLIFLKRLREGANVRVYTGPTGAAYWLPVSIEVHVQVIPDGYEYTERCDPGLEWGLRVQGLSDTLARGMVRHYSSSRPTGKHKLSNAYNQAEQLIGAYAYTEQQTAIVVHASPIEIVTDPVAQLELLSKVELCAMDYEWNEETLAPEGLSVATHDHTWYLPLIATDYVCDSDQPRRLRLAVADTVRRTPTIWHNGKADIKSQWPKSPLDAFGCDIHDTLVMAYLAGETDLSLKSLTRKYLDREPLNYPGSMAKLSLAVGARYGGADSRNTYDLFPVLWKKLEERQQLNVYETIERPLIPLLADMEQGGHPIDLFAAENLAKNFLSMESGIRSRFWAEEHLDIAKDADIRELVRRRTGYDPGSCRKEALAKIQDLWMDSILAYRQLRHQRRSFLDKHIAKGQGSRLLYLYTDFNQAGLPDESDTRSFRNAPRSGRLSSSGGVNLQNQPTSIRSIFVPPSPYHVIWCVDYSQLEYRIGAAITGDKAMIADINSGDPHEATRLRIAELTGVDIGRVAAKGANFGGSYGGHEGALRRTLEKQRAFLDNDTLTAAVNTRKAAYPDYYTYADRVVDFGRITGYAETHFGRRRYDPDIQSTDSRTAAHLGRAFINHTLGQGVAADMLKLVMIKAVPVLRKYEAHLAIQAHDELEGWVLRERAEPFLNELTEAMGTVTIPGIAFPLTVGIGDTWEEAKG